jgi:hypothetical protein
MAAGNETALKIDTENLFCNNRTSIFATGLNVDGCSAQKLNLSSG